MPRDSDLEKEIREEKVSDWEDIGGAPSTRDAMTEEGESETQRERYGIRF